MLKYIKQVRENFFFFKLITKRKSFPSSHMVFPKAPTVQLPFFLQCTLHFPEISIRSDSSIIFIPQCTAYYFVFQLRLSNFLHDPTADVSTAILVDLLHEWTSLLPSDCTRAKYLFKIAMSPISPFDLSLIWHGPRTVAFEYYIACYLLPNRMIKQQTP